MKKHLLPTLFSALLLSTPSIAADTSNGIKGIWQTEKKEDEKKTAFVEISDCVHDASLLCGKIIALEEPLDPETKQAKLDKKNPDEKLRDRAVMGLLMLKNFEADDDTKTYTNGTIYSPGTGKTYDSKLKLNGDIVNVTGYVFFFSSTQKWTRVTDEKALEKAKKTGKIS